MKYIIERFEENIAICEDEDKQFVKIPKYKLPLEVQEGDCLIEEDGLIRFDTGDIISRKEKIKKKMKELFE